MCDDGNEPRKGNVVMSKSRVMHGLMKGLFASAVVVVLLGLGVGTASAQTGAIEGTVSDMVSSLPIEGAMVMVRGNFEGGQNPGHGGHLVFTDEQGEYLIEELDAGDYTVRCGAAGYLLATLSVVVVDGQTTVQDIALEPFAFGSSRMTRSPSPSSGHLNRSCRRCWRSASTAAAAIAFESMRTSSATTRSASRADGWR